jgi:hypothetical protein
MSERREKGSSRSQDNTKEAVCLKETFPSTYKATRGHELEHKKVNYDLRKMWKVANFVGFFSASSTTLSKNMSQIIGPYLVSLSTFKHL